MAPENRESETRFTEIVHSGDITEGIESKLIVRAGDLTEDYVGRFIGNHDPDLKVNYLVKILRIQRIEEGKAPGISLWLRHGELPTRPAYENRWHVPFDREFEIIDLVG